MQRLGFVQITRQEKIAETDFEPFVNYMYEQIWSRLFPPQVLTHNLSNTVSANIITASDLPIPDCMTCGACCASFVCVDVAPDSRISSEDCWDITKYAGANEIVTDRFVKRSEEDFSCTALEGTIGENVSCRIYEDRPRMCRSFEAGSDRCHAVRRAYGIEPFLDLKEMETAREKLNGRDDPKNSDLIVKAIVEETGESDQLRIRFISDEGKALAEHRFDPKRESLFQSEFEGLTVPEAEELIRKRTVKM